MRPHNSSDRFTNVFRQIYECFRLIYECFRLIYEKYAVNIFKEGLFAEHLQPSRIAKLRTLRIKGRNARYQNNCFGSAGG